MNKPYRSSNLNATAYDGRKSMAFTAIFAGLQIVTALTTVILMSKMVGPHLYYYSTRIPVRSMDEFWVRNVSFLALHRGGMDGEAIGQITASEGNRIFATMLDSMALTLIPVLIITLWSVFTVLKLPESKQTCAKISPEDTYSHETMHEHCTWHVGFFMDLVMINFVFIIYVTSPADLSLVVFSTLLLAVSIELVTMPREGEDGNAIANFIRSGSFLLVLTTYVFIYTQARMDWEGVMSALFIRFFLDMMLIVCHSGGGVVMEHIVECRILYLLCNSILLTSLYVSWGHWR